MGKERIQYLDICKGVGIIFVVLGHIIQTNPIRTWIYSFHMPLFFFLSGYIFYFTKITELKNLLKKIYDYHSPVFYICYFILYLLVSGRKKI